MNSLESDLKRSVISIPFLAGVILEFIILLMFGPDSDLFRICVPILGTFPYTTAWILDYQSGFIKFCVSRTGVNEYIFGKIAACGVSGGLLEVIGCYLYSVTNSEAKFYFKLIFMSGMLWAVLAATLAAWSNSKYIAYGSSFVIYYVLVILHDRYFKNMYCLYPYEWINPQHTWVLDEQGIVAMISGMTLILACIYYEILRRCINRV